MRTYKEKLDSLDENSVWIFTKQDISFDVAFKSAKLFYGIPDKEHTNIEEYYQEHYVEYDIPTNRHRELIIPQLYGLITKTPLYSRGGSYANEVVTEAFETHKNCSIGSEEYNIFKSEQLLKVKIHAIIDSAGNNDHYNILPIPFIYEVLRILYDEYKISKISLNQLYTYIMTCKDYEEIEEAVYFISNNCPTSDLVPKFKDRSRVLTFIRNNINLFIVTEDSISINPAFKDYFDSLFIRSYDLEDLHFQLRNDVDYSYFLYNNQFFGINLIDTPSQLYFSHKGAKKSLVSSYIDDEENDGDYLSKVNRLNERNMNADLCKNAYQIEPVNLPVRSANRKYKVNPYFGKTALINSCYLCQKDISHMTFTSKTTKKPYMEAHHLIPVCYQKEFWDKYHINIDCPENIVCLCPTCHKAFHYGDDDVRSKMIESMYEICKPKYDSIGLNITLEEIKHLYNL